LIRAGPAVEQHRAAFAQTPGYSARLCLSSHAIESARGGLMCFGCCFGEDILLLKLGQQQRESSGGDILNYRGTASIGD
jgi:hypothetical protein